MLYYNFDDRILKNKIIKYYAYTSDLVKLWLNVIIVYNLNFLQNRNFRINLELRFKKFRF